MRSFKLTLLICLSVVFLFSDRTIVRAATSTPTPTPAPYGKVCLNGTKVQGGSNGISVNGKTDHNVHLTGSGLPTDQNIYIVGCVAKTDTFYCKSDSAQNDAAVAQLGFPVSSFPVNIDGKSINYNFSIDGNKNPVKAPNGTLDTYAHSQTSTNMAHSFFAVFQGSFKQTPGVANSLQYATFDLNQDAKNCVSVHWDPEGKIFDAQSLEPLPGTTISLLDAAKKLVKPPVLKTGQDNPQYPDPDGQFNFDVLDGTYYLNPIKSGYSYAQTIGNVDPHYTKAYSCDPKQGYPLYLQQSAITVNGYAVSCDVPLKSTTGKPYYAPKVTVLNYYHSQVPKTFTFIFGGQVSHPLTKISLVGHTSKQIIIQTSADVDGNWDVSVDASSIPQADYGKVDAVYTKVDLTKDQAGRGRPSVVSPISAIPKWVLAILIPQPVEAQQSVVIDNANPTTTFEPIFPYLEGYAYDKNGTVLPNATVIIRLTNHQENYYKTQADANGYFVITPDNLPSFPYDIIIVSVNSSNQLTYSTSQFADANKTYLSKNNINLMIATKNGIPVITVIPKNTVTPSTNQPPQSLQTQASQANAALIVLLVLILLLFLGGGLYLYMRKKNAPPESGESGPIE